MSLPKQEISAAIGKELVVEWALRQWELGLVNDLSVSNLTRMSMLDTDILESAYLHSPASVYPGLDLYTALKREVSDVDREAYLKTAITTMAKPENVELLKEVERLIDKELADHVKESVRKDLEKSSLRTKAAYLAGYRVKKGMEFQTKPADYNANPKKYEFKVYLTTLIGGHGGSTTLNNNPLFFNYATKYHYFMKILQDETQLSTIPPMKLKESRYISPTILKARLKEREGCRHQIERGYTVLDGPWLYRFRRNNQVETDPLERVQDEASYRRMVDSVKGANTRDPKNETSLLIVHAMDKTVMEQWDEQVGLEEKEEEERMESFKSMLWGDGTEEDIGEPYSVWMRRKSGSAIGQ